MPGSELARPGVLRGHAGPRRVLVVLCLTQITSWGILFYGFPVLAPAISADAGWSDTAVIGAFSVAQLVSAVVGVPVGRLLDRRGPRVVMTTGSLLAVGALAVVASARSLPWFYAGWVLVGVAMAGVLYQPAFAALTRWHDPDRRVAALTVVTVAGGLASTVFAPLTATLAAHLDWRQTYLVLAAVLAAVTVPAHLFGLRLPWPAHPAASDTRRPTTIARSRPFVLLVVSMSLGALAVYAIVVAMVPLFAERGLSTTTAAWALGLGGVGQVLGRLGYGRLVARSGVKARTAGVLLVAAATTLLLGLVPGPAFALIAAAALAGVVRGIFTLIQATAVTDRWGTAHYGQLSGVLHAPLTVTAAVAPWAATALAGTLGGYPAVFAVLAALGVVAALVSLKSVPPYTVDRDFRGGRSGSEQ
ncbi:MFS transporter [Saccharothrix luteola]|uniref:MFS transporter n=1 Tax=Saccharothrix luteola TaxID=2893018 RepID=UPI001E5452FA|nr:MFS transporter [Saccharothrix luteola]MCC8249949.1 MFS transporter [Saccharothrix luteola]